VEGAPNLWVALAGRAPVLLKVPVSSRWNRCQRTRHRSGCLTAKSLEPTTGAAPLFVADARRFRFEEHGRHILEQAELAELGGERSDIPYKPQRNVHVVEVAVEVLAYVSRHCRRDPASRLGLRSDIGGYLSAAKWRQEVKVELCVFRVLIGERQQLGGRLSVAAAGAFTQLAPARSAVAEGKS
jgi:hypothetical protein